MHLLQETVWYYRQREGQMTRVGRPSEQTGTVIFAMRDQPDLYACNFDLVVDFMEPRLEMLDAFRHRYGPVADVAARVRRAVGRLRRPT